MFPTVPQVSVPTITGEQMVEVDRIMIQDLGIGLVQMMENAGRSLARLVNETYLRPGTADHVIVLAGTGGNGGGGLVAARRLAGWSIPVSVWIAKPSTAYGGVIAHQLRAVENIGVRVDDYDLPPAASDGAVVIDALVGYSLTGQPRGRVADLIVWTHSRSNPIVSLDVPSGIESTSGFVREPAVVADTTLTLALPKTGLVVSRARRNVGAIFVADIGVPASLYRTAFGLEVNDLFTTSDIVRLTV